jgi:hypothetical protein
MPFTSETAAKAGRKSSRKGVPNKTTKAIRQYFQELLTENLDQLKHDIAMLAPENRIRVLLELSRYVVPRLNAVHYIEEKNDSQNLDLSELTDEELEMLYKVMQRQELLGSF